ncbi:MAG: glycosyltransferase [Chloroflexi bacterium]|nr:glycosyltransferase [Chloroflexota bacterium]
MAMATRTPDLEFRQVQEWLCRFPPDAPVVVVPIYNAFEDVVECLDSLAAGTPSDAPILLLDDASTDPRLASKLEPLAKQRGYIYVRRLVNSGFVETVNLAFEWCAPRDVVILNSDVVVSTGWLERLKSAACSRSTIATATPFTNNGTIVSIPHRNQPSGDLPGVMTTDQVDARIRAASLCLLPILPTAIGHCTYFKRQALDRVGYFDPTFSPGYGEEVDFSQRAVAAGFLHVLADDVFVFHKGSRSFGAQGEEIRRRVQGAHEQILNRRYPWYLSWRIKASTDVNSPLAFAIERARGALLGYRIAIDATRVDGSTTGTQVLTLELIRALAHLPGRTGHLAVIIADTVPQEVLLGVDRLVDQVIRVSDLKHLEEPQFDLIHRPYQVRSTRDLLLLRQVSYRFILSQLDCIAYSNPSYAESPEAWAHYRSLTEHAFALADGITFLSRDVAEDAAHQGLRIPEERACVMYAGVDHRLHYSADARAPLACEPIRGLPFVLMMGTSFRHKNRVFGLRVFKVLLEKHSWTGYLVLAGPNPSCGGSETEESLELAAKPALRSRVLYLSAVDEAEKRWLFEKASLVLYPSTVEGFGLVPFEAAAVGTPALTLRSTSLSEILGEQVIYLETLDSEASADTVWSFLCNPEVGKRQVDAIRARAALFKWESAAKQAWDLYNRILSMPPRSRGLEIGLSVEEEPRPRFRWATGQAALRVLRTQGPRVLLRKASRYIPWPATRGKSVGRGL